MHSLVTSPTACCTLGWFNTPPWPVLCAVTARAQATSQNDVPLLPVRERCSQCIAACEARRYVWALCWPHHSLADHLSLLKRRKKRTMCNVPLHVRGGISKIPSRRRGCPRAPQLDEDLHTSGCLAISTRKGRPLNVRRCKADHANRAREHVLYMKNPCPTKTCLPLLSLLYGMFTADSAVQ